jgi:hypothetical protein
MPQSCTKNGVTHDKLLLYKMGKHRASLSLKATVTYDVG